MPRINSNPDMDRQKKDVKKYREKKNKQLRKA